MGNDNKIMDLDIRGTNFLPDKIRDIDAIKEFYSLEEEFAKTKKNSNYLLYFGIFLFFTFVIGSAIGFTVFIQSQNKNVEIKISEFEDLRLKEVIDSARSHENNLDLLLIRLEVLKTEHKQKVLEAIKIHQQARINILSKDLTEKDIDHEFAIIRKEELKSIALIDNKYEAKILEKEKEIADTKADLSKKKDDKIVAKSDAVNNIDRLNELKMTELKEKNDSGVVFLRQYYEDYIKHLTLLYNPVVTSKRIEGILETKITPSAQNDKTMIYHTLLNKDQIISRSDFNTLNDRVEDYHRLMNRILRIPYKNSAKPVIEKIDLIVNTIQKDHDSLFNRFINVLSTKNEIIDDYETALDHYLSEKSENGFIINADNLTNIHIHMNKSYSVKNGTTALVFRQDDQYIGRIEFTNTGRTIRARTTDIENNQKINPFDKILLEIK
ncbi:hypothetical protein KKA14_19305 [bacterium]|nr:hypothetical protein [bacterium]